jgi:hypothetical protein
MWIVNEKGSFTIYSPNGDLLRLYRLVKINFDEDDGSAEATVALPYIRIADSKEQMLSKIKEAQEKKGLDGKH